MDDDIRLKRMINTDSPAASKKVFEMANALKKSGIKPIIISMGRGKPNKKNIYFSAQCKRKNGIITIYAPFSHNRYFSNLISFLSMPYILLTLKKKMNQSTVIFYNRTSAYILVLIMGRILKMNCVLDLEDTELINAVKNLYHRAFMKFKRLLYNKLCNGGSILACRAMASDTSLKNEYCYYGAIEKFIPVSSFSSQSEVKALFGGTITADTGSELLFDAINALRTNPFEWCGKLEFVLTGKGDAIEKFRELESQVLFPRVKIYDRLTKYDYESVLSECDIGLALKANCGSLANTTFPSKVIEYSAAGLLNLTTNISDVKFLLGDGAVYLEENENSVSEFLTKLDQIMKAPETSKKIAKLGARMIEDTCSINQAGKRLANYLFGDLSK